MAFRLLRICDNEQTFETRLEELKKHFLIPRNYRSKLIDNQFDKVRNLPGSDYTERRKLALIKRPKNKQTKRVIGVFDYNPLLPKISTVLSKHHRTMINENPELSEVFPEPPMAALRQGPNLRKLLCKAKLTKVTRNRPRAAQRSAAGWKRCSSSGGNPCNQCPYTPSSATSITSHITGYTHHINSAINCKTENLVYAYKCKKCTVNFSINTSKRLPKQTIHKGLSATNYFGKSTRKFNRRLYEHLYYVTTKKMDEPSAQHFCQAGHSPHDLIALGVEHVRSKDPFVLKAREHLLIKKFDSYRNGLNQEP